MTKTLTGCGEGHSHNLSTGEEGSGEEIKNPTNVKITCLTELH